MTITRHHSTGSGNGGGVDGNHPHGEPSLSTVTITQVKPSHHHYPMMETTSTASSERDWEPSRAIDDADDRFHFPSRISEEMLAADIRETTINCDGEEEDEKEVVGLERHSLIESVNEQLESIEELLQGQKGGRKYGEDKSVEAVDDDDEDCLSEVVSTRDAGTTPPPQSPSRQRLTENDAIILPTIIPRSLSDDNLYYTEPTTSTSRERDVETHGFDLARFDLDFDQTTDEDEDDEYYRRETTPPFPLSLDFEGGRGNHNELSRYDDPLTSADHTDDEMAMSTPEDDLREDLEALRRTKARYDAFFQEISQSLNDSGNISLGGSHSLISNDDDVTSRYSNETRTSSLNNTLDSGGSYDYDRRRVMKGGRYEGRENVAQKARASRIMQTRTGSYDEENFQRTNDDDDAEAFRVSADVVKRNSLEMKYKLPGFCPDAHVTTGSLPVNASEFFFDSQF